MVAALHQPRSGSPLAADGAARLTTSKALPRCICFHLKLAPPCSEANLATPRFSRRSAAGACSARAAPRPIATASVKFSNLAFPMLDGA